MDPAQIHPTEQELLEYGRGKLPLDASRSVHTHLRTCKPCQRRLDELNSEEFLAPSSEEPTIEVPAIEAPVIEARVVPSNRPAAPPPKKVPDKLALEVPSLPPQRTELKPVKETSPKLEIPAELKNHSQYEVVKVLGAGGMGIVYLVRHRLTERKEVLKIIQPKWLDRVDVRQRFLHEIQAAAKLDHPNVVKTLNALQEGNMLGLVMEYAPGESMTQVVKKNGPLPVDGAISLATQAAMGLAHAHSMGMVHRDIKPSNLQVTKIERGLRVKILDFGLAKLSSKSSTQEAAVDGGLYGTPLFMAPEQAVNHDAADIRADIYSLGCTLYFMLTGKPPFEGKSAVELVKLHAEAQPTPAYEIRSEIPLGVIEVLDRMMAKNPKDRYRDPQSLILALKECLHQETAFDDDAMTLDQFLGSDDALVPPSDLEFESEVPAKAATSPGKPPAFLSEKLPPPRPKKKVLRGKKKSNSLMPIVLGSLLPTFLLIGVLLYKKPWEWFPGATMGSIVLGEIDDGVEILVDGNAVPWKKDSLRSPSYIPAEPGSYDISFRYQGNNVPFSIEGKKVTHTRITVSPRERKKLDIAFGLPNKATTEKQNETKPSDEKSSNSPNDAGTSVAGTIDSNKSEKPDTTMNEKPAGSTPEGQADEDLAKKFMKDLENAFKSRNPESIAKVLKSERPDLEEKHPLRAEMEEMVEVGLMVDQFHTLRMSMMKELKATNEIPVGESRLVVVENDGKEITLRASESKTKKFRAEELTPSIVSGFVIDKLGENPKANVIGNVGVLFSKWLDDPMTDNGSKVAFKKLEALQEKKELSKSLLSIVDKYRPVVNAGTDSSEDSNSTRQAIDLPKDSPYRFERRLDGHSSPVVKIRFFADGKLGSFQKPEGTSAALNPNAQKNFASTWLLKTGARESSFAAMTTGVRDFTVSPNGKMITFYTGTDGTAKMELWVYGEKTAVLESSEFEKGDGKFFFSTDGKSLLACDNGQRTIHWTLSGKSPRIKDSVTARDPFPREDVVELNVSPDLSHLAVMDSKGHFYVCDTKSGESLAMANPDDPALQDSLGQVHNCYFSRDNKKLLVCRENGRIDLLSLPGLELVKTIQESEGKIVSSSQATQNRYIAVGSADKRVTVVDLDSESATSFLDGGSPGSISAVSSDGKGDWVAVGFSDGSIRLYRKR